METACISLILITALSFGTLSKLRSFKRYVESRAAIPGNNILLLTHFLLLFNFFSPLEAKIYFDAFFS